MIVPLVALVLGLGLAGAAATVGVAAAAVSQLELTRWVSHRLRGVGGTARLLENPAHLLAIANALTTLGIVCAALAVPALLAETTPTFEGVFTVAAGVPLFVSAAYLVPRVVGRRWAEPIVERALPWLDGLGRALAPLIARQDASPRTALAAVLSGADTEALAAADEMAVVSAVLKSPMAIVSGSWKAKIPAMVANPGPEGNVVDVGTVLFGHYPITIEVAGVFLLIAMVGAIVLAGLRIKEQV